MSISLIIPTYRNPEYLDICLKSAIDNQVNKNEIIVAIDGYIEESQHVLDKYKDEMFNIYSL
jgi:glycosyltransferase involved in cell wall biosynthesis